MPALPSAIPSGRLSSGSAAVATFVTALRMNGCAIAIRICPASAAVNVSLLSRTAPPIAVSHAPVSSAGLNARSSASPAGMARIT